MLRAVGIVLRLLKGPLRERLSHPLLQHVTILLRLFLLLLLHGSRFSLPVVLCRRFGLPVVLRLLILLVLVRLQRIAQGH